MRSLQLVHQNSVYTCPTALQDAVAAGLEAETPKIGQNDSYWKQLAEELEPKRDRICKFLHDVGMNPTIPDGGYFLIADFSQFGEFLVSAHPSQGIHRPLIFCACDLAAVQRL